SGNQATRPVEVAGQQSDPTAARGGPEISAAEKTIRLALDKPLTVRIKAATLPDAVRDLAKAASVSIVVDRKLMLGSVAGSVTLDAAGRSLRSVLDELERTANV